MKATWKHYVRCSRCGARFGTDYIKDKMLCYKCYLETNAYPKRLKYIKEVEKREARHVSMRNKGVGGKK